MRTACLLFAAVIAAVTNANTLHSVDFRVTPEQKTLQLKSGDLVRIALAENPTTGYNWKYANPFEDALGIYSVQMDDFEKSTEEGAVGKGGVRTIVLKAEKSGSENFEIVYVRSWEYKDFVETQKAANGTAL